MPRVWYSYDGTGDPTLASNYLPVTVTPGCENGTQVCAIYAFNGGTNPTAPLSANLRRYIANALATNLSQPQIPVNAKKYVYMKLSS
jgi:hypothetical protein